jgi:hypothetical protein
MKTSKKNLKVDVFAGVIGCIYYSTIIKLFIIGLSNSILFQSK